MNNSRLAGQLVKFRSLSGLHLDGILYESNSNHDIVVHVHGSLGNFYQNLFLQVMARSYLDAGLNFLSFNSGAHDGICEGYRNEEEFEYVGGSRINFSSCVDDIGGAINFVRPSHGRVILQGHSLGCDRILHYLLTTGDQVESVLLSPCDSFQLHANWIAPESVASQIARIRDGATDDEFDWLPSREYGMKQATWTYAIPITRRAFLSIAEGPPFRLIKLADPQSYSLGNRLLVYIGGRDELQVHSPEAMRTFFAERAPLLEFLFCPEGDHNLAGVETEVALAIIRWAQR